MGNSLIVRSIVMAEDEPAYGGFHLTIDIANMSHMENLPYPDANDIDSWNTVSSVTIENAAAMRKDSSIGHPELVVRANVPYTADITTTPETARQAIRKFAHYLLNACGTDPADNIAD